jgi:hypothetical protein
MMRQLAWPNSPPLHSPEGGIKSPSRAAVRRIVRLIPIYQDPEQKPCGGPMPEGRARLSETMNGRKPRGKGRTGCESRLKTVWHCAIQSRGLSTGSVLLRREPGSSPRGREAHGRWPPAPNTATLAAASTNSGLVFRMSARTWKRDVIGVAPIFQFLLECNLGGIVSENG